MKTFRRTLTFLLAFVVAIPSTFAQTPSSIGLEKVWDMPFSDLKGQCEKPSFSTAVLEKLCYVNEFLELVGEQEQAAKNKKNGDSNFSSSLSDLTGMIAQEVAELDNAQFNI